MPEQCANRRNIFSAAELAYDAYALFAGFRRLDFSLLCDNICVLVGTTSRATTADFRVN
jgi:hypothetical protein